MNLFRAVAVFCSGLKQRLAGRERMRPTPLVSSLLQDEPELAGLVEKFVKRFPEIMSEMTQAAANAEWSALQDQAHNLKGVGGGCGYPQVSAVAAELETAAARGDAAAVGALLDDLQWLAQRITRGMHHAAVRKEDG